MPERAKQNLALTVDIDGIIVPVQVRPIKTARRYTLRVARDDGQVTLTLPPGASRREARQFVESHLGWIARERAKCAPPVPFEPGRVIPIEGQPARLIRGEAGHRFIAFDATAGALTIPAYRDPFASAVERWLKAHARRRLEEAVASFARALSLPVPRIALRDPRTRWGSCSTTGTLSFSWRLIMAPPHALTYVAAHEIAHFKHFDHSPAFWRLVKELDPECEHAKRWLRGEGLKLHAYGRCEASAPEI